MQKLSISEIKAELKQKKSQELIEFCLRLAKYKNDNKELLTYLIWESQDEKNYIKTCQSDIDELFESINRSNHYLIKKGIRKISKLIAKRSGFSEYKETEIELWMYFLTKSIEEKIPIKGSKVTQNIYLNCIKKIRKLISSMHEDLQYDYLHLLEPIENSIS